jgi:intracellular multiplication protein IcmT
MATPHWRNTFKQPRFFFLDARVGVFLLFFLLHIRIWTLAVTLVVFVVFFIMERYGYDFASALRAVRSFFSGPKRPPVSNERVTYPVDYDRRPLF